MKKIIQLNDIYHPQDSVSHGQVKGYDASGNKVFDKSNMIVKAGRNKIKSSVLTSFLSNAKIFVSNQGTMPSSYDMVAIKDGSDYKLGRLSVNSDGTTTSAKLNDVALTILEDSKVSIDAAPILSKSGDGYLMVDGELYYDNGSNKVQYANNLVASNYEVPAALKDFVRVVLDIDCDAGDDSFSISDLGILIPNGSDLQLFSRVCFDRVAVDENNSYKLIYYIYF